MTFAAWPQSFDPDADAELIGLGVVLSGAAGERLAGARAALRAALVREVGVDLPDTVFELHAAAVRAEEETDEAAWAADDAGDDVEYSRLFRVARGFGSMREISDPDADDEAAISGAIYELYHSMNSISRRVLRFLETVEAPWPALVEAVSP